MLLVILDASFELAEMREHHFLLRPPLFSAPFAVDVLRIRRARVFRLQPACMLDCMAAIPQNVLVEPALIGCQVITL